jgi:hypothetical protein
VHQAVDEQHQFQKNGKYAYHWSSSRFVVRLVC